MGFISNETFYLGLKVSRCSQTLLLVRDIFNVRLVLLSFKCTSISKLEGVVQNKFRSHLQVVRGVRFYKSGFQIDINSFRPSRLKVSGNKVPRAGRP